MDTGQQLVQENALWCTKGWRDCLVPENALWLADLEEITQLDKLAILYLPEKG